MDTASAVNLHLIYLDLKKRKYSYWFAATVWISTKREIQSLSLTQRYTLLSRIIICMETIYSATTHFNRSNKISIPQVVPVTLLSRRLHSVKSISQTGRTTCRWASAVTHDCVWESHTTKPRDVNTRAPRAGPHHGWPTWEKLITL